MRGSFELQPDLAPAVFAAGPAECDGRAICRNGFAGEREFPDQEMSELSSGDLPLTELGRIKRDEPHVIAAIANDERPRVASYRVGLEVDMHRASIIAPGTDHDLC